MEPAQKPLTPEFIRGVNFCLEVLRGVADGIRDNPMLRHEQRRAAAEVLLLVNQAITDAIKDKNDAPHK